MLMPMHVWKRQNSIASGQQPLTTVALNCSGFLSELGPYYPTKNGEPILQPSDMALHNPAALETRTPIVQ